MLRRTGLSVERSGKLSEPLPHPDSESTERREKEKRRGEGRREGGREGGRERGGEGEGEREGEREKESQFDIIAKGNSRVGQANAEEEKESGSSETKKRGILKVNWMKEKRVFLCVLHNQLLYVGHC